MKTKFPKSFVLLIAAMVIIVALFVTASAKNNELSPQSVSDVSSEYDVSSEDELPMSGYCGENIKWELDENGVLKLEGSGDMYDFNENNYCYGYYPADPSSSTTRNETTTAPYSYYPTTRPYSENTTYYPATTAPYSQEHTTNPYSDETTYYYGTTTAPATTVRQETTTYPQYSTTTYYQEPTSGYSESTTVYYGTTTAPTTTARQETTTYPQYSTTSTNFYQEPTPGYSESTSIYYGTTTEPGTTAPTTTQPATTYYPTTTSPYYPDLEPTTSHNSGDWTYGKIYRWNLHFDEIKEVIIGEGITSVGYSAFANCTNLKSVMLPSTLTSIDSYAFKMCISLEEISVPDSVEAIGNEAFYGCLNLKKITLGNGIKSIAYGAFKETGYYINEDNWVNNVLYIDNCLIEAKDDISGEYSVKDGTIVLADNAFEYCRMLTSVTMPDSVINIGNYTFWECHNLSKINIPEGITNIGYSVFNSCFYLSEITIPDSVTNIGNSAFSGCIELTSITIPDSVTSIGRYAFENCNGLTSITIPDSVTSIGDDAFYNCAGLTSITVDENNPNYSSNEAGELFNKDKTELIRYPIGNKRTEYTLPDSVTSIGDHAFSWCTGLTSVSIGNSVTSIGNGAFYGCTGLTSVTIPDSITRIGYNAFSYCDGLTSVTIPDSVTIMGDNAFYSCTGLTSITVDENNPNYSSDESGVLYNKYKTELIQYPIGNERTEYTIPDSVTSIGDSAFSNCTGLTSVSIGISVTNIGDSAFYICTGLTSVTIPDSVTSIGYNAFYICTGLTSITVDENNANYSSDEYGVLFNKDKTKLIQYPIGNDRIKYIIPESVTSIGDSAFKLCTGLTNVTIPKSICYVNWYAFSDCYNLNTVYYSGSPSMWNSIFFDYGNDDLINATIIFAEENPPEPATIVDEGTNIGVDYDAGKVEGEVGLSVEQAFDGKAFDIISTELEINDNVIYDIKMTVDGVETQPSGTVTVRIPLPEGYDPTKTFVYHVNTQIGTVERMNAVYEDGYLVFETDHFSYYAVVELKDGEPVEERFKVTWNSNGVVAENEYKEGDRITVPQNPTKEGCVFVGWSPSVPEFMPANNLEFFAVFEKIPETHTVTWIVDGRATTAVYNVGDAIVIPANPSKSGYLFVRWSPSVPSTMPAYDLTFTAVFEAVVPPTVPHFEAGIVKPSTSSVDYGDSIILHAQIDGALPEGAYIVWSGSNGNFNMSVSDDGMTCKISPRANGKTTFTITVYDKDGKVISSGTQVMTAKAGLWQRIVAIFKNIFGLTKTIPQIFKGVF